MAEIQWWYARGDEQFGPVSVAELRRLAATAALSPTDLVWRDGMAEWAPAVRLKGLFPETHASPHEPAPREPAHREASPPKPDSAKFGAVKHASGNLVAGKIEPAEPISQSFGAKETGELPPPPPGAEPLFASFLVEPASGPATVDVPPATSTAAPPPPAISSSRPIVPGPLPAERQRITYSHLARILAIVQAVLWGTCVLVILLGGLLFTWTRLRGRTPGEDAASAAMFATFFIGAYVVARAGEKISRLVLEHLEDRRG